MQEDFHQEDGHFSDLDQKRSGILLTSTDHEENGTESLNWWWSNSEKADTQSSEPRVHCLEERSKAKEVENYRYTSVPMGIRLKLFFAQLFLLISSVSTEQSQMCEEYSTCQTWMGRPVLAGQSDPLFAPANLLIMTPRPSTENPAQEDLLQKYKERVESVHNKIVWLKFVLMQDSEQQLKSDCTSWQSTLKSSHNLQNKWHVVSTLCQEMKNHLAQKVGFEGTPKFGPYWKLQPAFFKVCKDNTSKDPFSRCEICKNLGYKLSGRWLDKVGL